MPLLERVEFGDGRRQRLEDWLHREIFETKGNRNELERKWEDELERWRAKVPEGAKSWPFEGASNIKAPVTAMHTDPILADLMSTLHADDQFWNVEPRQPNSIEGAKAWREALKYLDDDFLKMRETNRRAQLTNVIHGTAFYKTHWLHERKTVRDYNPAGEITEQTKTKSHPVIDHVPIQDFYFPAQAWDIRQEPQGGARWVAEKFELHPNQLRQRAQSDGAFQPAYDEDETEFVIQLATEKLEEEPLDDDIRELADYEPFRHLNVDLFEVWAEFDVDGDGIDESIQVIWHQETQTILRALYNPFLHGKRPYEVVNYLPTQSVYGIGIAEANHWAQKVLNKLLNAQVDNVLLANTRMFSAPLGSGIQPGEPIYPNKVWLHGPGEEIDSFQAGEVYPSLFQTITQFMDFSEKRTGASEAFQGNVTELPSRTPASTTINMLQQSSKRFEMVMANMRPALGRLGLRVMQNLAQYYRENPVKWEIYFNNILGEQQARELIDQLQQPIHNIESGFNVDINATSRKSSPEVEKQNFLSMLQIASQVYGQIIQTASLFEQAPEGSVVRETAQKAYQTGVELLGELFNRHDIQNAREMLPNLQAFQQQTAQVARQAQQAGVQTQLGGPQGAAPFAQAPEQTGQLFGLGQVE